MTIRASDDVVFRDLAGEAVLLNLTTGIYFGLNGTGTRMWSVLLETGDKDKAVAKLVEEFEVETGQIRHDLEAFIHELTGKGLLKSDS